MKNPPTIKRYNDLLPEFKKARSDKTDRERIEDLEIAVATLR